MVTPAAQVKPEENIDNTDDLENESVESVEDDTVLIEEDVEVDPTVDVGIKPNEGKEDL